MAARARNSKAKIPAYGDLDAHHALEELLPGERAGPPLPRTRRRTLLRGVVLLTVLGGGWALLGDQETRSRWLPAVTAALSSAMDRKLPGSGDLAASAPVIFPTPKPVPADPPPLAPVPPVSREPDATPGAAEKSQAPPLVTATIPPAAAGSNAPPAAPLPPPIADPADPYQVRAAAVGLHPGLSRVLLARLTPTDYRNAGIAIRTALAETADDAVFIWPRQRKPELALFHVRFVPGAAPDCRRYVVTVTKDGWLTTALPMERCGPQLGRPRRE
jgi:hypothetical protein